MNNHRKLSNKLEEELIKSKYDLLVAKEKTERELKKTRVYCEEIENRNAALSKMLFGSDIIVIENNIVKSFYDIINQ